MFMEYITIRKQCTVLPRNKINFVLLHAIVEFYVYIYLFIFVTRKLKFGILTVYNIEMPVENVY